MLQKRFIEVQSLFSKLRILDTKEAQSLAFAILIYYIKWGTVSRTKPTKTFHSFQIYNISPPKIDNKSTFEL